MSDSVPWSRGYYKPLALCLISIALDYYCPTTTGYGSFEVNVTLVNSMGDDTDVVRAAKVSTQGVNATAETYVGLINYLMRNKHMSPFEHVVFTFKIEAPIFVAREYMRHRTQSINEESGRYKVLENKFYYPHPSRPLKQIGKTSEYKFDSEFDDDLFNKTIKTFRGIYGEAWKEYQNLLDDGVAKEVARMILPVGIYTTWFSTMNARNLMHFLDLRLDPTAQWEIRQVANMMEDIFKQQCPVIYEAWQSND